MIKLLFYIRVRLKSNFLNFLIFYLLIFFINFLNNGKRFTCSKVFGLQRISSGRLLIFLNLGKRNLIFFTLFFRIIWCCLNDTSFVLIKAIFDIRFCTLYVTKRRRRVADNFRKNCETRRN